MKHQEDNGEVPTLRRSRCARYALAWRAPPCGRRKRRQRSGGRGQAGFQTSLNIGVTLTDGNSETLQTHAALVTEGEREGLGSLRAGVEGRYGESTIDGDTETTVETAGAFGGLKKTLSPKTYASLDAAALYDDIAEIDYRVVVSPGLGLYLVKEEDLSLSVTSAGLPLGGGLRRFGRCVLLRFFAALRVRHQQDRQDLAVGEYLPVADDSTTTS